MPRARRPAPGPPLRQVRRRTLGPLHTQRISALALHRYTEHVKYLVWWLALLGFPPTDTELQLDLILQDYIEQMWDANAGLQAAQAGIAGLRHTLKHSVKLRGAWRLLGVWQRAEPPSRAPPMSDQV